jgi:hypothetical protein
VYYSTTVHSEGDGADPCGLLYACLRGIICGEGLYVGTAKAGARYFSYWA